MLSTQHRLIFSDSRSLRELPDASVALVVTSPPYPMVSMWDPLFSALDEDIPALLESGEAMECFDRMHRCLLPTWSECARLLCPGGLMVVNIGDATRKIGDRFQLFENHARVLGQARELGLDVLPDILWRKPNNSPTKFLGSGMLPPNAYVTYEHEYVLVFRNGGPRKFSKKERLLRRNSAFFWEERNQWFSDLWSGLPGVEQDFDDDGSSSRNRSAAFPRELAWRLIQMFSLQGDTVLDPFLGTGTTMLAAMMSGRNSIGVERDHTLSETIRKRFESAIDLGRKKNEDRLLAHESFVTDRIAKGRKPKYEHAGLSTHVMTRQETDIRLLSPVELLPSGFQRWDMRLELLQNDRNRA